MSRRYEVYQMDAFTRERFSGNPAGVVLDAEGLAEEEMQRIAREMNDPETVFVFPGREGEYDLQMRFYSVTKEVPLCGHGTVAAHVIRAAKLGLEGKIRLLQKTIPGVFPVEVERHGGRCRVVMYQGGTSFQEPLSRARLEKLCAALGIAPEDIRPDCPVCAASTGSAKMMVGLHSLEKLHSLRPDMAALTALSGETGVNGYFVFVLCPGEDPLVHGRMFAPANGNPEDPVTGTANGPLGGYLVHFGLVPTSGKEFSFTAMQGEALGRPGTVDVTVALDEDGRPGEVSIAGEAVLAFRADLELDD